MPSLVTYHGGYYQAFAVIPETARSKIGCAFFKGGGNRPYQRQRSGLAVAFGVAFSAEPLPRFRHLDLASCHFTEARLRASMPTWQNRTANARGSAEPSCKLHEELSSHGAEEMHLKTITNTDICQAAIYSVDISTRICYDNPKHERRINHAFFTRTASGAGQVQGR